MLEILGGFLQYIHRRTPYFANRSNNHTMYRQNFSCKMDNNRLLSVYENAYSKKKYGYGLHVFICLFLPLLTLSQSNIISNAKSWEARAKRVTIHRDEWGVPHIYGKTDADAVFGIMYAQCEDNYWQLEETIVKMMGRYAMLYGEKELDRDATIALHQSVAKAKKAYTTGDATLKQLSEAAAAGVNYYLLKHPDQPRRFLQQYEPWHFLLFPSPDGANHMVTAEERKKRLTNAQTLSTEESFEQHQLKMESGSNAIALAPSKTKSGNSMLLLNPHVNFFGDYQRYEAHLVSEEGLNASGFAMLGQFWIWSGFTENHAWTHTNTASDYDDVYLETFDHPTDTLLYRYGNNYRKATVWSDTILYKTQDGIKRKVYQFMRTHHGPVIGQRGTQLLTLKHANAGMNVYVTQAWAMSKAKNLTQFKSAMAKVGLTTNTMYADKAGTIAFWNGNAIPKRDTSFNWMWAVDGSNPATEWKGMHTPNEIVHLINPSNGWLQNCNSTPFQAAGNQSPSSKAFPAYMAYDPQTYRAMEAVQLLSVLGKLSMEDLQNITYSTHLPMMKAWMPQLVAAFERQATKQPLLKAELGAVIDTLKAWDHHSSVQSTATTLGFFWTQQYGAWARNIQLDSVFYAPTIVPYLHGLTMMVPDSLAIQFLQKSVAELIKQYGSAFVPFGEINRLQRIHTSGTLEKFDDEKPSLPVPFAPGSLGSLPAFRSQPAPGSKRFYGTGGNSYTALVELGPRIKTKSVVTFGQSANPASPHYFDQAPLYVAGKMKEAWYYKEDVIRHSVKSYHPGEE